MQFVCKLGAGACSNKTRVRRDALERCIIEPIKEHLLDPERIQKMAAKLRSSSVIVGGG